MPDFNIQPVISFFYLVFVLLLFISLGLLFLKISSRVRWLGNLALAFSYLLSFLAFMYSAGISRIALRSGEAEYIERFGSSAERILFHLGNDILFFYLPFILFSSTLAFLVFTWRMEATQKRRAIVFPIFLFAVLVGQGAYIFYYS